MWGGFPALVMEDVRYEDLDGVRYQGGPYPEYHRKRAHGYERHGHHDGHASHGFQLLGELAVVDPPDGPELVRQGHKGRQAPGQYCYP